MESQVNGLSVNEGIMQQAFEDFYRQADGCAAADYAGAGAGMAAPSDFIRRDGAAADIFYDGQMLLFQKRTALFMRRSFPAYAQSLTEAEQEKLAINVQKRAALKDFRTEKEIWHYLIAIMYCGFFFEQDKQYSDILSLIGWHGGGADKNLILDRLLDIIDEYALECEKDFADFDKKLRYLAEFYAEPHLSRAALEELPAAEQIALGGQIAQTVFPARLDLWTEQSRNEIIAMALQHAKNIGLGVKDGLLYLPASIYFGRAFELSPLYPWAYFLQNRNIPPAERGAHFIALLQKHLTQLAE